MGLTGEETAWDPYWGGIGHRFPLFFWLSARNRYIGVEIVPAAIEDAKANAALNGMDERKIFCWKGRVKSHRKNTGKGKALPPMSSSRNPIHARAVRRAYYDHDAEMAPGSVIAYVSWVRAQLLARDPKQSCKPSPACELDAAAARRICLEIQRTWRRFALLVKEGQIKHRKVAYFRVFVSLVSSEQPSGKSCK
ncbi:MAG: hypothetical protein ACLTSZ_14885 [Lachnospiraceae bacterium]